MSTKSHFRQLFSDQQEKEIKDWLYKERDGNTRTLPRNGRDKLRDWILERFKINITLEQLDAWISKGKRKGKKTGEAINYYTDEQRQPLHHMRNIRHNSIYPGVDRTTDALKQAILIWKPNQLRGPWSNGENVRLLNQFQTNGTNWSKYNIAGRNNLQIKKRFSTLLKKKR